jgi:sporulation-control protein spo0M
MFKPVVRHDIETISDYGRIETIGNKITVFIFNRPECYVKIKKGATPNEIRAIKIKLKNRYQKIKKDLI